MTFFSVLQTSSVPQPGRVDIPFAAADGTERFEANCFYDALGKVWPDYFGPMAAHSIGDFRWMAVDTRNDDHHRFYLWQGTPLLVKRYTAAEAEGWTSPSPVPLPPPVYRPMDWGQLGVYSSVTSATSSTISTGSIYGAFRSISNGTGRTGRR